MIQNEDEPKPCTTRSHSAHLDHGHRVGENIRLLTALPATQDFRWGPPWGVATLTRGTRYGIYVLSHCSEAEIRDERATRVVNEDVWLAGHQHDCEMKDNSHILP